MKSANVERLLQKWMNEPAFRAKLEKDFEGAIKSSGISLSYEELEAVRHQVKATADEALHARVSKGGVKT